MPFETLDMGSSKRRRVLWEPQSNETVLITTSNAAIASGIPLCPVLSTYQEQWAERRQGTPVHVDVTALASSEGLLVGCTSWGEVFLWEEEEKEVAVRRWQVSSLPLKSIQIRDAIGNDHPRHDRLVLVGGKEGMWTIPLKDHIPIHSDSNKWDTVTFDVRQILVDMNRVFVLGELGEMHVYALPDNKLVQTIDLNGSKATTMALAGSDEVLAESDHDSQQQSMDLGRSLLIGTADSKILQWTPTTTTTRASKVEVIGLYEPDTSKAERTSTGCRGSLPFEITVTAMHCTDDNWWIIAGIGKNKKSPYRNILATLHGSTRTLICQKVVRETIHGIHYQSQSAHLYTIANEGVVSVWDSPYRLELMQRLWSSPPSARAIVNLGSTMVAVAGIGPKVDLFENNCRVQSLLVKDHTTGTSTTSTSPKPSGTGKQQ